MPWKAWGKEDVGLDGRLFGNYMRFANHDFKRGKWLLKLENCELRWVLYRKHWHGVFVALKDIDVNEEVFISYGERYAITRGWPLS